MRPVGIVLFASLALAACSPAPEQAAGEEAAAPLAGEFPSGTYVIDPATGETRAVVNNEDGTTTLRAGERVVPRLPEGFSVYPGAEIRNTIQVGGDRGSGVTVSLASKDSPADLVAFYRLQATAAGVAVELDLQTEAMTLIAGEAQDGTSFTFQVRGDPADSGETGETTGMTIGELTVRRGLN